MTPASYALRIAQLDSGGPYFSAEVEKVIREALADEGCRLAALIDDDYLNDRIQFPSQAAQLCREQANTHTVKVS